MANKRQSRNRKKTTKSLRIRKGDQVIVIAGEGKSSSPRKVLSVLPSQNKVVVEGVNVMKDSQPKQGMGGNTSGQDFVEKPYPIHISNVMLVDPQSSQATRIRINREDNGVRRIAVKSGQEI